MSNAMSGEAAKGWVVFCTKDGNYKKIRSGRKAEGHCYEVFHDSPIGKALEETTAKSDQNYVLLMDISGYSEEHNAFAKLKLQGDFHFLLNVGKEWVFRDIFSTGCEIVSDSTGSTMQSFQTRLKREKCAVPALSGCDVFRIITHVTGCAGGQCYACECKHNSTKTKKPK